MPKEVVNHVTSTGDLGKGEWEEAQFSLHWTASNEESYAEGYAQIAVELSWDQIEALIAARNDGTLHPQSGNNREGTVSIYSDTLSRYELNRLVRHAKRARDAVHGADE